MSEEEKKRMVPGKVSQYVQMSYHKEQKIIMIIPVVGAMIVYQLFLLLSAQFCTRREFVQCGITNHHNINLPQL